MTPPETYLALPEATWARVPQSSGGTARLGLSQQAARGSSSLILSRG